MWPAAATLRLTLRRKYGVGSTVGEELKRACCAPCSLWQMKMHVMVCEKGMKVKRIDWG